MIYLKIEDYFEFIFEDIKKFIYDDKAKPSYENDAGIEQFKSILDFVKNDDYYPTILNKAAYLLISISTGHKFRNGNKRLALFTFAYFLHSNNISFKKHRKKTYRKWFKQYFPKYKMSPNDFLRNVGWALYNFNKCINIKEQEKNRGHNYNYDDLKNIAEEFTNFISNVNT